MEFKKSFIEEQNENATRDAVEDSANETRAIMQKIVRDRRTKLLIFSVVFSLLVPVLIYFAMDGREYNFDTSYTCATESSYRVLCGEINITDVNCTKVKCCYDHSVDICYHRIPSPYKYIKINNTNSNSFRSFEAKTPFHNESNSELTLSVLEINSNRLQIILHTPDIFYSTKQAKNKTYIIKTQDLLGVEIFRAETNELLLTTFRGPLIASEGFWEWTFQLTCEKLYGLGELLIRENTTVSKIIYKNKYEHSTIPSFMAYLNGSFYGVVVEHDGPLEITVLPSKLIILKSLAGNRIILNIVTGPRPQDIRYQLQKDVPRISVPYWALGAHICRDGNATITSAIEEYLKFQEEEKIVKFASDCIHENLYSMLKQTSNKYSLDDVLNLKNRPRIMMSIPPQVFTNNLMLYDKAVELDILYKNKNGTIFVGSYLGQEVVLPDFNHPDIKEWFLVLNKSIPINKIEGYVLRDNWPKVDNYTFFNDDYTFPYLTKELILALSQTIPWDAKSGRLSLHIIEHNNYAKYQVDAFKKYMKHDFLLTSSFVYGLQEATLIQNVDSSWANLKKTITKSLYHSIFGNSLISIPVCGSTNNYNTKLHEQLCIRWYSVASTLPLLRVSSDFPRRDPSSLTTNFARDVVIQTLRRRYRLLPYFYTIINSNEPLIRPMFYHFYLDNVTLELEEQYMIGDALLVAQTVLPATTNVQVYLPPSVNIWYEFWGGNKYQKTGWINMPIIESDWIMFIGQGKIVPERRSKDVTVGNFSVNDCFGLVIALNCTSKCFSEGNLNMNPARLTFVANETGITVSNIIQFRSDIGCGKVEREIPSIIEGVVIYGLNEGIVTSNFTQFDLCDLTTVDEMYIDYFLQT